MKKFVLVYFGFLVVLSSCASKRYVESGVLSQMIAEDRFSFVAEKATPMDYSAVNNASASIPGAVPMRILDLSGQGYTLEVQKDVLFVHLPYFGRAYNLSYGGRDAGFNFESKDFYMTKTDRGKRGMLYTFDVKDQPSVKRMSLEIFSNGRAYLSISSSDRQPISYDGFVTKVEEK